MTNIKRLVWDPMLRTDGYFIEPDSYGMFGLCKLDLKSGSWTLASVHKTEVGAKSAAQSDFETYVMSCVSPT